MNCHLRADASEPQTNEFEQIIIIPPGSFAFTLDAAFAILLLFIANPLLISIISIMQKPVGDI
jgi:hypothetical protein